jgi:DNA-binding NtrC family response regulator
MSMRKKRLLFVDDQPSERALYSREFEKHAFDVTLASNVIQALELIHRGSFDVLIADLKIHEQGDGLKLARAIREQNPRCVTIILTAYPDLNSAVEGIHYGVDDYVVKSDLVDVRPLVATIEKVLSVREPKARILSVSYDEVLLRTRLMLLQREGYEVVSTFGFTESLKQCTKGDFDLLILGHSIPASDKQELVSNFKENCKGPIVSLRRQLGEASITGADVTIDPEPELLLRTVSEMLRN